MYLTKWLFKLYLRICGIANFVDVILRAKHIRYKMSVVEYFVDTCTNTLKVSKTICLHLLTFFERSVMSINVNIADELMIVKFQVEV